jgi:predicted metal-dependent peptidase
MAEEELDAKALYAVSKAKAILIIEHPFYASLLCNMPFVEDKTTETMAVDGSYVYYNPEFVNGLSTNESKFVLAHEVMHCALDHMGRLNNRDHYLWNVAGDYIINDMLVTDSVGKMPDGALYDQNIVKAGNYTTDGVYKLLPKGGKGRKPGNLPGGGQPFDELRAGNYDDKAKQDWEIRVVQAGIAAKNAGNLPAGAKRLIDSLVQPKVAWQEVLRRFVSKQAKDTRSFSRPNRRFLAQGMYLPAMSGEKIGRIAVAVDCSGSISNEVLREFASEIHSIKQLMNPAGIDVLYFDSEVSHTETYGPEDEHDIKAHGGGGTAFSPIFKAIDKLEELPVATVVLTDLCCDDFGNAPEYPVLWVTNYAEKAPWGEIIKM